MGIYDSAGADLICLIDMENGMKMNFSFFETHCWTDTGDGATHTCARCSETEDHNIIDKVCTKCGYANIGDEASVTQFATKAELVNPDNFTLHKDNGAGVAQRVSFGNEKTWYIAGVDKDGTLVLLCDPATPFGSMEFLNYDRYMFVEPEYPEPEPEEGGALAVNGMFGSEDEGYNLNLEKYGDDYVYASHYGASDIRKYLCGEALDEFSEAEKAMIAATDVYTKDIRNRRTYITADKLYLGYGKFFNKYMTVGANSATELFDGIMVGLSGDTGSKGSPYAMEGEDSYFWLRTADESSFADEYVTYADRGRFVDHDMVHYENTVLPALNMDLSSVIFASTATAASPNATLENAMTLRLDGEDKVKSGAFYDASGIKVAKGSEDNEYLYVQYKDGDTDKVWSRKITDDMDISKDCIGLERIANCKIWIEKKDADENLTYAVMASIGETEITGHPYSITEAKHTCPVCAKEENHDFAVSRADSSKHICVECGIIASHDFTNSVVAGLEGQQVSAATCTSNAVYKKVCSSCHALGLQTFELADSTLGHKWNTGAVTKEPTCTEKGSKKYTCANPGCSQTKTEEINAKGHTEVVDSAVAATCGAAGKTEGSHCAVCNTLIKAQEDIPATGEHTWDKGKVIKKATTTKKGIKKYTCEVCAATRTEAIGKVQKISVDSSVAKKITLKTKDVSGKKKTYNIKAKAKTSCSYKLTKGSSKYVSVSSKGKITIKKGAKKGTYVITVTAKKNKTYQEATKKITIVIKK